MRATRAQLSIIRRAANTIGVELPAEITGKLDRAEALVAAAEGIAAPGDLAGAVLEALADGRDYHKEAGIQRLVLDHVLVTMNIGATARGRADIAISEAVVEYADDILSGWAEALEPHSAALASAAEQLPTGDLDDTDSILRGGAEAMRHWAAAQDALKKWAAATEGFGMLAMASSITVNDKLLVMAQPDGDGLERARVAAQRDGSHPTAWTLARHGVPLSLATLGDYMERSAEREQQRQAAAKRYEKEQRELSRPPSMMRIR